MSELLAYALEWANLLVRWLHVTVAMAWIGTSFYYIALDYHLIPLSSDELAGEVWEIHGGGFYRVEKFKVAPKTLPSPLHWFKWEAYTTWLSGFALLVVLYYANANTYMVDRSVADMPAWVAVAISLAILIVGWLVYDGLCRLLTRDDRLLAVAIAIVIAITAFGVSHVLSPRAAFLQVGAMIGTWMAANVLVVIIPGQRELVKAKQQGREPEAIYGIRGKQRSVHNNYFTLPVLFAMLSNHFSFVYSHDQSWLILLVLIALGAWTRHFFNLRNQGRVVWAIPISAGIGVVALGVAIAPRPTPSAAQNVTFAQAQAVIQQRCVPCHSATPTMSGFTAPPNGITFDTPEQIVARSHDIEQQAVITHTMPFANATNITEAERDLLGAWVQEGAPGP